jgi:LPXTG-motif cell wall-anchored protein
MKRQILSIATAMALTAGGAIFAQSTLNTPAPGPSQETKPGQTNNNLQNPGSHMQQQPTTTTTTTVPSTATTTSTDMNNDSTVTPPPADTTTTTPTTGAYNSNSGTTTGSSMDNTATSSTTTTSSRLPKTASDMPTVALMGLLALSGFFGVRAYAKRNA